MIKIAIVEDDEDWLDIIKTSLEEHLKELDNQVIPIKYENESQVLEKLNLMRPSLAILDINMANSSRAGIRLAEKIKKVLPDLEFRFLSSQKSEDKDILWDVAKLSGEPIFEKSDFKDDMQLFTSFVANIINKKFSFKDMIIRKPLKILVKSREVYYQDKEIKLTPMEYEILVCLTKSPNVVYSKIQLYNQTKSYEVAEGTSEETVVSHIKSIRDKFKKVNKDFHPIETVTNSGYKYKWKNSL